MTEAPPTIDLKAQAAAAKAYAKAQRPWYKKKRWIISLAVVALIAITSATSGGGGSDKTQSASDVPTVAPTHAAAPKSQKAKPAEKPKPTMTKAQENAIGAANDYLDFAPFSRAGLIRQLSSKAGDGYSVADATFAVDHLTVDWNEQAVKAGKNYLEMTHFSRAGLIQQLTSKAGDQYTQAQAVYAANKLGL